MTATERQTKKQAKRTSSQKAISPVLRIALLLGICVHFAAFLLIRVVSNPLPVREDKESYVQYISDESFVDGSELEETAALFDSAPLFVPTQWNASQNLRPIARDREWERFSVYEPSIQLVEELLPTDISLTQSSDVDKPIELLDLRFWDLFRGFGQEHSPVKEFSDAVVFAEIRSLAGNLLKTITMDAIALSSEAEAPVGYFVRVDQSGRMLGSPTLAESSGDRSFDIATYELLTKPEIAAQLPNGLLEIRVYP